MKTIPALRPITPAVAEEVRRLIAVKIRAPQDWDALIIYESIGMVFALTADGILLESMEDSPSAEVPMEAVDPRLRIGAMIVGVRRFPFLRAMLPERQAGTKDCAECHGTGDLNTEQLSGILCITCGGLGWHLEDESPHDAP